ncbi:MAG: hypothetical protein R2697_21580 [Ilumatobacteraceae bacterium]
MTSIPDLDLHLFTEGRHRRAHDHLGAHPVDGSAVRRLGPVGTIGPRPSDADGWSDEHELTPLGPSGIWAGVVEGAGVGTTCNTSGSRRSRASRLDKADRSVPPTILLRRPTRHRRRPHARLGRRRVDGRAPRTQLAVPDVHLRGPPRFVGRTLREGQRFPNYRDLADPLADHRLAHGFTHVEFLPIMEHPFYGSWGYQTTGLLRAHQSLRVAAGSDGARRPAPPARWADPRLGAVALPHRRPRARPVRRHPPVRARRPARGSTPTGTRRSSTTAATKSVRSSLLERDVLARPLPRRRDPRRRRQKPMLYLDYRATPASGS